MSLSSEKKYVDAIVNRLLDNLSMTVSSQVGEVDFGVRRQTGKLRANYILYLSNGTFADELLACFTAARQGNAKLAGFFIVHNGLFAEAPQGPICTAIVQLAIAYCLAAESRIITVMPFGNRNDVDAMMQTMKGVFDTARDIAADAHSSAVYQQLTYLAGTLTNHLATTARQLPRMITFHLTKNFPILVVSQRVYYDPTRALELLDENKIIHPLFCPREIMGLSR